MYTKTLSEERLNANLLLFTEKLQKYNCYSEQMMEDMGELIKNGSYSGAERFGGAYRGALVDVTLNILCKIGFMLNERVLGMNSKNMLNFPLLCVNNDMLMRVLLLVNIAKSEIFIPNPNEWKRNNGYPYEFNDDLASNLKIGQRTLMLCNKYGIKLSEEEFEAISVVDNEDEKGIRFRSPLAAIVMSALSLTLVELHQEYRRNIDKSGVEK